MNDSRYCKWKWTINTTVELHMSSLETSRVKVVGWARMAQPLQSRRFFHWARITPIPGKCSCSSMLCEIVHDFQGCAILEHATTFTLASCAIELLCLEFTFIYNTYFRSIGMTFCIIINMLQRQILCNQLVLFHWKVTFHDHRDKYVTTCFLWSIEIVHMFSAS